jgi:hypothetical protein
MFQPNFQIPRNEKIDTDSNQSNENIVQSTDPTNAAIEGFVRSVDLDEWPGTKK